MKMSETKRYKYKVFPGQWIFPKGSTDTREKVVTRWLNTLGKYGWKIIAFEVSHSTTSPGLDRYWVEATGVKQTGQKAKVLKRGSE